MPSTTNVAPDPGRHTRAAVLPGGVSVTWNFGVLLNAAAIGPDMVGMVMAPLVTLPGWGMQRNLRYVGARGRMPMKPRAIKVAGAVDQGWLHDKLGFSSVVHASMVAEAPCLIMLHQEFLAQAVMISKAVCPWSDSTLEAAHRRQGIAENTCKAQANLLFGNKEGGRPHTRHTRHTPHMP